MDDKLLLAAFHNGVNSDLFIHKLYEKEPQSMVELVHLAYNFMNAEDVIIAKKRKRTERMEANPTCHFEALIQKRDGQKIQRTEMARRQALSLGINNTLH